MPKRKLRLGMISKPTLGRNCLTYPILLLLLSLIFFILHPRDIPVEPANIAYFYQITPATVPHFPRLFAANYHLYNTHLIHFDVTIPQQTRHALLNNISTLVPSMERTHVIPSQLITYNGVSMILNTLAAMEFLLDLPDWHFFINLSGSDYPIIHPSVPRTLLAEAIPYQPVFLSVGDPSRWQSVFKGRAWQVSLDGMLTNRSDATQLHDLDVVNPLLAKLDFVPAYSEAWMIASRPFVKYCTRSTEARRLLLTFANMHGSDEFFFATLAYNSPVFNRSLVHQLFRKVVWRFEGALAGQHPFYLDERDNGKWKFLDLLREAPQFHARKFKEPNSPIMDEIDLFRDDVHRINHTTQVFQSRMQQLKEQFLDGGGQLLTQSM